MEPCGDGLGDLPKSSARSVTSLHWNAESVIGEGHFDQAGGGWHRRKLIRRAVRVAAALHDQQR